MERRCKNSNSTIVIFRPILDPLSVTLSVETPLCPYGNAYRRGYWMRVIQEIVMKPAVWRG